MKNLGLSSQGGYTSMTIQGKLIETENPKTSVKCHWHWLAFRQASDDDASPRAS
jgi:hypothetical protein